MPRITSPPPRNGAVTQLTSGDFPGHPRESSALAFSQGDFQHPFSPQDLNTPREAAGGEIKQPKLVLLQETLVGKKGGFFAACP